jgi:hypothetical protein
MALPDMDAMQARERVAPATARGEIPVGGFIGERGSRA